MKITQDQLHPVSTGKSEDSVAVETRVIKNTQGPTFNLMRAETERVYCIHGIQYARDFGFKVVDTPEAAINLRLNGELALSLREADTVARMGISLDNEVFRFALLEKSLGTYVPEDDPGGEDIWYLRHKYNQGLKWKKEVREWRSQHDQIAGDQQLSKIIQAMQDKRLPAWPEELEHGFPVELTKPEFMTWDQFTKARRSKTPEVVI